MRARLATADQDEKLFSAGRFRRRCLFYSDSRDDTRACSPTRCSPSAKAYADVVRGALDFSRRLLRALRIAAADKRIRRPLRWIAALCLLPIPGPFDDVLLVLVAMPLALLYRRPLAEAWRQTAPD